MVKFKQGIDIGNILDEIAPKHKVISSRIREKIYLVDINIFLQHG